MARIAQINAEEKGLIIDNLMDDIMIVHAEKRLHSPDGHYPLTQGVSPVMIYHAQNQSLIGRNT